MSSARVLSRATGSALRADVCVFCQTRQLWPVARNSSFRAPATAPQPHVSKRNYAQKLDVKRLRADVDKKARLGWYKLTKAQKILLLEPDVAEAIYNDFVAHKDKKKEYGNLIKQLMTKYNVTSEHISGLALMTYSIPDLSDPKKRSMLPPSAHKPTASLLLQGCADLADPLALKHILTAVYLHTYTTDPNIRDIALLFPKSAVLQYRKMLPVLQIASHPDPEALTLHGLYLEQESQPVEARACYEKALAVPWVFQYSVQARHPAQLPITAPWNALGYLLAGSRDAQTREHAKRVFGLGAIKGDDPLACAEYAARLERGTGEWLKFTSKAAASGHRGAMVELAGYYRRVSRGEAEVGRDGVLQGALNWLLGWRKGSAEKLAVEWFEAAGKAGHKGALLQLAEWYEERGEREKARDVLLRIVDQSETGKDDEFAQVVHTAKGLLSGIRTA